VKPYYERGGIQIFHGDCQDVLPLLTPHSCDLLLTDPPYAAAAATVTTGFGREKWGGNWGDMSLVTLVARQVLNQSCLAPRHEVYWFCDLFSFAALMPLLFGRYALVQSIVWDKDMLGLGAYYRKQTELILYARTSDAPPMGKSGRDLIRLRPLYATKEHPAEKPLALIRQLAAATVWTRLLDPFMGTGPALLAARSLGRHAVGIEIEERYCEIAARRLQQDVLDFGEVPA
jgi:site-specific DNA-methyltransferase (adenine-specific)